MEDPSSGSSRGCSMSLRHQAAVKAQNGERSTDRVVNASRKYLSSVRALVTLGQCPFLPLGPPRSPRLSLDVATEVSTEPTDVEEGK